MKTTDLSEQQKLSPAIPQTHDDLTIAENLKIWRRGCTEGEESFSDGENPVLRIPEEKAKQFIQNHGPLHPGDYSAKYQRDWRDDFRELAK